DVDPARQGLIAAAFADGFADRSYAAYADWALDVPMIFVRREGRYLDPAGMTFRQFLERGLAGQRPNMGDWEDHLTTLFPEVRATGVIEVRAADACDAAMTKALAALWKGLLYDNAARADAWDLVSGLRLEERAALMLAAGREGLTGRAQDGRTLASL